MRVKCWQEFRPTWEKKCFFRAELEGSGSGYHGDGEGVGECGGGFSDVLQVVKLAIFDQVCQAGGFLNLSFVKLAGIIEYCLNHACRYSVQSF